MRNIRKKKTNKNNKKQNKTLNKLNQKSIKKEELIDFTKIFIRFSKTKKKLK